MKINERTKVNYKPEKLSHIEDLFYNGTPVIALDKRTDDYLYFSVEINGKDYKYVVSIDDTIKWLIQEDIRDWNATEEDTKQKLKQGYYRLELDNIVAVITGN